MDRHKLVKWMRKASRLLWVAVLLLGLGAIPRPAARAAVPGLPFREDFADTALRDSSLTTADWSTAEEALLLARRGPRYGAFGPGSTGVDISADTRATDSVALGDVDGDGDLDMVAGNRGQPNRLYLNNGTADPFSGVSGLDISADAHQTSSLALGDVDRDGDLDLAAGNDGQANRLYLNNGTTAPFLGVAGVSISADAGQTSSLALGDVDGDGDLDLAAGNRGQPNRLYLNNGTTAPFLGVNGLDITADAHDTSWLALGDVDGDGDLDLVAGNDGQRDRLYLNNGTASPFGGAGGLDISADAHNTNSVALGDVDGDGDLDLVAGNDGQRNRLYLNDGSPSPFSGVGGLDVTADAYRTRSVFLGDVDGDGDLDLAAGNRGQPNRLYLNNGTATPFLGVGGLNITIDAYRTSSLALGDVDRDGDLDVAAGNANGQVNRLYLNNGTSSPFSGVSGLNVSTDAHDTSSLALGDVDGDGDLDVAVGNRGQPNRLYLNNGTASPFSGVGGIDISADAHNTNSVALGDVDGDGDLDVVVGNGGQPNRLYLNNGTATPFSGVGGIDISADGQQTFSVALGDVDRDGDLDLAVGNVYQPNRLYLNDGTADPFGGVSGLDVTADAHQTNSLALGDADGDGYLDVAAGNGDQPNRLYLNASTPIPFRGVSGVDVSADAHGTRSVALGDVDRDGDLDLAAGNAGQANRLYLNNGTADPFRGVNGVSISADVHQTYAVALGDVDGDGDLDLAAGNNAYGGQVNRLYLNNGTADPFRGVSGVDIGTDAHETYALALGDVDGDGDLDLVAGNGWPGSAARANRLYLNNGTATPFHGVGGTDISVDEHNTSAVVLGDVDGDGDLDLVAGNRGHANRLYLNNGTASPFSGVSGMDISADVRYTYAVALGDVDRDGDLDLVAGNEGAANRLYLNNGTADPFGGVSGIDVSADAHHTMSVALGDVDRDGDLDLVAGNGMWADTNRLYLNNGTAAPFLGVSGLDVSAETNETYAVALGDADRDGSLDIVAGNYGPANRLYLGALYYTGQGRAVSLRVNAGAANVADAFLMPIAALPPNTGVTYWLSNNGGTKWFIVRPGVRFVFPTAGSDLRWRAELASLSPVRTPRIDEIRIGDRYPLYVPLVLR